MQSLNQKLTAPSGVFITELASGMYPAEEVASRFGYTRDDLLHLLNQGWFKARLTEAKALWSADSNAAERVRVKASLAAEHTLLDITRIIQDNDAAPASRISAHAHLTKLAAIDNTSEGGSGGGFRVVINLPNSTLDVTAPRVIEGEIDSE